MLRVFLLVLITSSDAGTVCACVRSCGGVKIALSFTMWVCFTLWPRVVMVAATVPNAIPWLLLTSARLLQRLPVGNNEGVSFLVTQFVFPGDLPSHFSELTNIPFSWKRVFDISVWLPVTNLPALLLFLLVELLLLLELAAFVGLLGVFNTSAAEPGDFRRRVTWFWRTERRDVDGVEEFCFTAVAFKRLLLRIGVEGADDLKETIKLKLNPKSTDFSMRHRDGNLLFWLF